MDPILPSNTPAAERSNAGGGKWAPPGWLLDFAPDGDQLMAELIDVFKAATEASLLRMRTALATADLPKLRSEAHRTRGSAGQVGAEALADLCLTLELVSNVTPVSHLAELVDRIQERFDETGRAMALYSAGTGSAGHSASVS